MKFSGVSHARHLSILEICTAYESGFGHGVAGRNLDNPYEKYSNGWVAYDIGHAEGWGKQDGQEAKARAQKDAGSDAEAARKEVSET